ncbi:MAG: hypothetical protein A2998_01265 [Candidatus Staskawiczbacteria bacterium RIFCSPLOWO2_01_FULL_37_25b]|uniref:PepSY domain-containing protein n=2 Tax=Candidatus Staskawicziibacteriota TaxID=1817916 RepID=A0A1G2HNA3_9BACT|nr:MAG: hypothetical protein A2812_02180 [Candidatus Staskawiczbacteria bacterium RIFCSPHIGHO2_01_FULL_36_16]OGZ73407.1 MAG: hypothetical protein A2998_01265 [Candidatus Staskawiczbacteria bacterium RIFCSPLOWO2_01_FULL_37_25b]
MKTIIWAVILFILVVSFLYVFKYFEDSQKVMTENKIVNPLNAQKANDEIYIHKIAGLGDEFPDKRTYDEACQTPKIYLDKRYSGILEFELLESDYKEENAGIDNSIYRYQRYTGGQYSCFFKGTYIKKLPDFKSAGTKNFVMEEFGNITFEYPDIEGFELKQNYNAEKKAGEIIYYSTGNLIPTGPPSNPPAHRHPILIIQKVESKTKDYSIDKINTNPNGIKYKIWDEHDANNIEFYFNDPYDNLDTTIEFDVSDKEVYLITTVNFIYNGISEQPLFDIISNSFKQNNMADISSEEALKIAEQECKKENWEFKDISISDEKDRWFVLTNKSFRGGNAFIYIDKKTGEVINKTYNLR